jgi:CDP-diacylglycerol---serine O-phosphatidyltransferase
MVVAPWAAFVAILMISNVATYTWASFRLRRHIRLDAILLAALVGTALFSDPWITLIGISVLYLASIPFSMRSYARVRRPKPAIQAD